MKIWKSGFFWQVYLINLIIIIFVLGSMFFTARVELPEISRANYEKLTSSTIPRFRDQLTNLSIYMRSLAETVQKNSALREGGGTDDAELMEEIAEIVSGSPFVDSATVVGAAGRVTAYYPKQQSHLENADFSVRKFYQQALVSKKVYISDVQFSEKGRPEIVVAIPILDGSKTVIRVVNLNLRLEENQFLRSIFQSTELGDGGYVYIVDRNGVIISHPNEERIGEDVTKNPVVDKLITERSTDLGYEMVTNTEDMPMYASYQFVPELDWGLVAQVPVSETMEPFKLFRNALAVVSILILFPLSLLTMLHARQIIKPIQRLYEAVDRVAKGDFEQYIDDLDNSEIGRLSHRFNEMIHFIREAREKIQYQAYHDPLTGLPNRVLLHDRLKVALTQAEYKHQMVAVLLIDLDRFKNINETLGHRMGDLLLQNVAERVTECAREGDTVSRLGGDEFIMILSDIAQVQEVITVANKIVDVLSNEPFDLDGEELYITPSIGISVYPNDGDDAETLVKNADMAMYRAKEHGRNNYQLHTPAMNAAATERLALENNLRRALDKDEFAVHYQPKIDLNSGRMTGMEALIRWNHSEWGLVPPFKFIPVAEETGLIVPIGDWVLRTACEQNKRWQEQGFPPMRVAVNLSGHQFDTMLVGKVRRVLMETGLEPEWLELEITESMLMKNTDLVVGIIQDLKDMGIHISIDDFGTGYSSLSYLERFPIDTLKIDQSFVRFIENPETDAVLARAIISLAHSLNLKVIAEGVETETQLEFLREENCDACQGYYFSKPVPAEEFETLMVEGSLIG